MENIQETKQQQQEATTAITPPPFHPSEEPQPQQATSPTFADRITGLGLDENASASLTRLTQGLSPDEVSDDLLATLAQGVMHDNDVQNADAAGYLRGRNEKIEAVLHPQPDDDDPQPTPVFPRYCRRSIWD